MTELIDAKRIIFENGKNAAEVLEEIKTALEELRTAAQNTEEG